MTAVPFTASFLEHLRFTLAEMGYGEDVTWSEKAGPPATADDLASEAIFVICNSGMKNTVARGIYERVMAALRSGNSASTQFGHKGKAKAIDSLWRHRADHFSFFNLLKTDQQRLDWCGALPWIGEITKYHLAKNFGVDVAKPDVHLQRLADLHGETVQGLCDRLAAGSGLKARTVDVILWRACAAGVISSRTGELL